MQLAIYSRDQEIISFQGVQEWDSVEQMLEYFYRLDDQPEQESLMGWGHNSVTWYGNIGVAQ